MTLFEITILIICIVSLGLAIYFLLKTLVLTDAFKTRFFKYYNHKGMRDKNGKIIPDCKRRKHSAMIQAKIDSGEIKKREPICRKRQAKGRVSILKQDTAVSKQDV